MTGFTCLFNPIDCLTGNVAAWFASIPLAWLLLAALVAGMLLGAWLGKIGVALVLTAGVASLALRRRVSEADGAMAENVDGPDAAPPVWPKKPKPKPKPAKPKGPQFPPDVY